MPGPIMVHVDYSGEFTVVLTQDGVPVDLSGAQSITMEVFDTPGSPSARSTRSRIRPTSTRRTSTRAS